MSEVQRMTFAVELADNLADLSDTTTLVVTTVLVDQMRAEREARRLGGINGKTDPVTITALWCWAACVRLGHTELKFPEWTETVVAIGDPEESDVDPTQPAALTDSA